jgi:hypothetical protein
MPGLFERLKFKSNPFENYVAEREPEIIQYLVRPRYIDTARSRATSCTSFILFGARGYGKSATRISLYKEMWIAKKNATKVPLVLNLIDFSRIAERGLKGVTKGAFVQEITFQALQAILIWLSALEEDERDLYVGGLLPGEEKLFINMLRRYYLSQPEPVRRMSATQMMDLLNQAWHSKGILWVQKRWSGVCDLMTTIASAFVKKQSDADVDLREASYSLFAQSEDATPDSSAIELLSRLVEVARSFGFTGVSVLVDKLDETDFTNNSALNTAALIFPILSNVQLLEIDGFGWQFYLWNKVRDYLAIGDKAVRLDKIPNAEIVWDDQFLLQLVNARLIYFSENNITQFSQVCDTGINPEKGIGQIIELSMLSPRELIRLIDTTYFPLI